MIVVVSRAWVTIATLPLTCLRFGNSMLASLFLQNYRPEMPPRIQRHCASLLLPVIKRNFIIPGGINCSDGASRRGALGSQNRSHSRSARLRVVPVPGKAWKSSASGCEEKHGGWLVLYHWACLSREISPFVISFDFLY